MAVKTSGAEWKRYYTDTSVWPDGWWHEHEEITVDGVTDEERAPSEIEDGAVVVIKGGIIFKGGYDSPGMSVEDHFRKWRKTQTTEFLIVEVSKNQAEHVVSAIVKASGKIVR